MSFPAVHPALDRALAQRGYAEPTAVQAAVLDEGLSGADLLVSAQTGSGKTVAFGLAAAPTLLGGAERFGPAHAPLALVIAPTRELAMQVAAELTWLYADSGARIATCVGGMDARREARALNAGAHIVVGTPGRLKDHIDRGNLDLSALKVVVLDEADEMLDMGFREDLEFILDQAPADRRTLLFSATIARDIAMMARKYQRDAVRIDATDRSRPHADIEYRAMRIAPNQIEHAVVNVLRFFEAPGALVFCSTREAVKHLQGALRERGFASVGLSGELSQRERTDALQALRDGQARVCVATDVAARGLDLPDLGLVIHAELPVNKATLLHRSGRTGRAGKKGVSVLLVPTTRRRKAEMLLGSAGLEATWSAAPGADEIMARDEERLLATPIFDQTVPDEDFALARKLAADRTPEELACALVRLMRKEMPAPEDITDPGEGPRGRREAGAAPNGSAWPTDRLQPHEVTWFRADIGRSKNADPKWLIPLICRLGGIAKKDIGSIRVFPDETRFEIALAAQAGFLASVKAAKGAEVAITPSEAPNQGYGGPRPKKPFKRRDDDNAARRPAPYRSERTASGEGDARPFDRKSYKGKPKPGFKPGAKAGKPAFKKKQRAG